MGGALALALGVAWLVPDISWVLVFAKLGVDDRTAAVTTAISQGIIASPRV